MLSKPPTTPRPNRGAIHHPPGPPKNFYGGESLALLKDPIKHFEQLHKKFGGWIRFQKAAEFRYLASDPEVCLYVLVQNHKNYVKSARYQHLARLIGRSLVTSDGREWNDQRKIFQPMFRPADRDAHLPAMRSGAIEQLQGWKQTHSRHQPIELKSELLALSLKIAARSFLGIQLKDWQQDFFSLLEQGQSHINYRMEAPWDWPESFITPSRFRFARTRTKLFAFAQKIIENRRRELGDGDQDLLSALLRIQRNDSQMTDENIREHVLTFLMAGHETTATALTWFFILLSQHRQVEQHVLQEVAALPDNPSPESYHQMVYLEAALKETLRLYPPAWILSRQSIGPDVIRGFKIPAGATINIAPYLLHRDPEYWPNPLQFQPERFLNLDQAQEKTNFIAFGAGPRACIGAAFAILEMKVIVSEILKLFRLQVRDAAAIQPQPKVVLKPNRNSIWTDLTEVG